MTPKQIATLTPLEYFTEGFEPARRLNHAPGSMRNFAKAVRMFRRFAKVNHVAGTIGKITPEIIQQFDDWLLSEVTVQTATDYGGKLRVVLHHAVPERFQPRPVGRPKLDDLSSEGTLMNFLIKVYVPRRIGISDGAVKHLEVVVRWMDRYLGRAARCDDLTEDFVLRFLGHFLKTKQWAPATVNTVRGSILQLWRLAHRLKHCPTPLGDIPRVRVPKRLPDCWAPEEVSRLLQACRETPGWIDGVPAALFWYAIVHVAYYTGLRIGAIRKARVKDVDFKHGTFFVPAEHQKHFADQRFKLHAETLRAVQALIDAAHGRELLFAFRSGKKTFYARYAEIQRRAGLPVGAKHGFHKIRRTTGTYLMAAVGINEASRFLGHSGIDVTKRYIDASKLPAIDTVALLPALDTAVLPSPIATILAKRTMTAADLRSILDYYKSIGRDQCELAEAIGTNFRYLSKLATGAHEFTEQMQMRLRKALGFSEGVAK